VSARRRPRLGPLVVALNLAGCTRGTLLPTPPPPQSAAQLERWRTPPALAPEPELERRGELQRVALDNGLHVTVVTRAESPSTVVRLWVPSAAEKREGPLVFVAGALRAGTELEPGKVLVDPRLGESAIGIHTDRKGTEFEWQVLPRASEHAVALLGRFVLHPTFEPEELKIRLQRELALIERRAGAYSRVHDIARGALPGLDEPVPEQEIQRLFALSPEGILHLYRCSTRPERAELVIVGPVSIEAALGWARRTFGAWQVGARAGEAGCARPAPPPAEATLKEAALKQPLVQLLGGSLGEPYLALALPGPHRESEDFAAFVLLSEVLRNRDEAWTKALRHAGATYGIDVDVIDSYPNFSLLEVHGQLEASAAAPALRALVLDIRGLEQHTSEAELETAKRVLIARHVETLSRESGLATAVTWELQRSHPPEEVYAWPRTLRAVDLEHCRRVARRWLSDAQPSIAVSSPPPGLIGGLDFPVTVRRRRWELRGQAN
jgi:predicted Zn-dependent peptidase